jgi:hypothetical protein
MEDKIIAEMDNLREKIRFYREEAEREADVPERKHFLEKMAETCVGKLKELVARAKSEG